MNSRATQQCNMCPYVYAVYWLPTANSGFLLARKCNWLAKKMLITCVMRNARAHKLQWSGPTVHSSTVSWRSVHGSTLGYWTINFTIFKIFPNFIWKNQGGAYFDAGSPLAVVSENFMRISRLLRHVFGFGAYSRTPSPDI